jgi:hypothetical protein
MAARNKMDQEFREEVISKLSEIQTKVAGIESHLLALNGSVVVLKGEQERIKITQAKRDEQDRVATKHEKLAYSVAGGIILLLAQHIPQILAALMPVSK